MGPDPELSKKAKVIKRAILIAGPTACGKSALAMEIAKAEDAVIINADSMQVYSVLRLLTARPSGDDLARATHYLYGTRHPSEHYSTGAWLSDVEAVLAKRELDGRRVVFVGGTGLYFRALLGGLSPMPEVPDTVRQHWRSRLEDEGAEQLHSVLQEKDPVAAATIKSADGQRIVRALEVIEVSGRSIVDWRADPGTPLVDPASAERFVITAERSLLGEAINVRFDKMLQSGVLDEVRALLALDLDANLPAMKAIGVKELSAAISGDIPLKNAAILAKTATRQYAKRQATWFKNQCGPEWTRIPARR